MKPVRIAVVGARGAIGRRHAAYVRKNPETELCAVVERDSDNPPADVPGFDDLGRMLGGIRPDGVILATPNSLHVPMALDCVAHGVPVLVEKPVADEIGAALTLVDAAATSGVPVLVGQHRRFSPIILRASEAIGSGALGTLVSVTATHLRRKPDRYFETAWRREEGGGALLINGIHEIDTLRVLCGEIDAVQATTSNLARGFAVEDTAVVLFRFRNGALGTLTISDAVQAPWAWELTSGEEARYAHDPSSAFLICGTAGSLAVPTLELMWNERGGGEQDPLVRKRIPFVPADPWYDEVSHFARIIRDGEAPRVTAADATRSLAAVLAIKHSATIGQWVDLDAFIAAAPRG